MPENATTPLRGFPYSADLDLFGAGRKIIEFCDRARIKTDFWAEFPTVNLPIMQKRLTLTNYILAIVATSGRKINA